jgi:hypothetical protein
MKGENETQKRSVLFCQGLIRIEPLRQPAVQRHIAQGRFSALSTCTFDRILFAPISDG